MAIVDSCYKYVLIDVGAEGHQSDGGVLKNSDFGKAVVAGELCLPLGSQLPGTGMIAPYAFIGDEAFQLQKDFMRPFPAKQLKDEKRIFNYRLSRARRCAENAFGITVAGWRILLRTINLHPKNVDYVVKATCVLHNFILTLNSQVNGGLASGGGGGGVSDGGSSSKLRLSGATAISAAIRCSAVKAPPAWPWLFSLGGIDTGSMSQ
ncbi:hypothetical protein V5799_026710 [Amblyomma americanum]|uniref:DDE Tnp4 domain-containing protein n=1 Tax=Amblyomma americanum TaxID=6943 RepID=A0AAQ4DHT3_AMBAM